MTDFVFTSRYGTGAGPDVETMCGGDCEGMGFYPVDTKSEHLTEYEQAQIALKREAGEAPDEIGYYFITCPDCGGSGKRPEVTPQKPPQVIPPRTLICGYCNAHNSPEKPCTCEATVRVREARRLEREGQLRVGLMGATSWGNSRKVDRR